jgi:hypothetical protein
MYCPKCSGGAFLSDEDLVKVLENTAPMKLLIKQSFVCKACSERFSRVVWDDIDARKKTMGEQTTIQQTPMTEPVQQQNFQSSTPNQAAAGIRFLDNL